MKTKFLMILMLISFTITSQNCRYEKNEIDKFTGKLTKLTNDYKLFESSKSVGYVRIYRSGDDYAINFVCDGNFGIRRTIKNESELSFLLQDGKIITLKKSEGSNYSISKADLMSLMQTKIDSVRFQYQKNEETITDDCKVKKGQNTDVQNIIKCVL